MPKSLLKRVSIASGSNSLGEKSLPHQYKALKIIQDIKNSARIYVHRIGFDPPPIKEESRLSGDIDEIKNFVCALSLFSSLRTPRGRPKEALTSLFCTVAPCLTALFQFYSLLGIHLWL